MIQYLYNNVELNRLLFCDFVLGLFIFVFVASLTMLLIWTVSRPYTRWWTRTRTVGHDLPHIACEL